MARRQTTKSGTRKGGRNSVKCSNYKLRGTREYNKKKRLLVHMETNKNDKEAKRTLKTL